MYGRNRVRPEPRSGDASGPQLLPPSAARVRSASGWRRGRHQTPPGPAVAASTAVTARRPHARDQHLSNAWEQMRSEPPGGTRSTTQHHHARELADQRGRPGRGSAPSTRQTARKSSASRRKATPATRSGVRLHRRHTSPDPGHRTGNSTRNPHLQPTRRTLMLSAFIAQILSEQPRVSGSLTSAPAVTVADERRWVGASIRSLALGGRSGW